VRYATAADIEIARTRGAIERHAKMITRAGKRYTAVTWELPGGKGPVFVVLSPDASAFLTEEEARVLGIHWDQGRKLIARLLKFYTNLVPYHQSDAKEPVEG
jgi:hypothetical protein